MNLNTHREKIGDDLISQGWTVLDNFFDPDLIRALTTECRQQQQAGQLKAAGVGRTNQHAQDISIRGDQIRWLEPGQSAAVDKYLDCQEQLRSYFNRQLFLGLEGSEQHFAFYPPGAFYQQHLDRFKQEDSRVISSVLYLNEDWLPGDGGELRLNLEPLVKDIEPVSNRFVLFISAQILHEVLTTQVERMSLTGWFKRRI